MFYDISNIVNIHYPNLAYNISNIYKPTIMEAKYWTFTNTSSFAH